MTITGRKVLIGFVAFFAVVFVVNGIFIALSLVSFPGVETENAYRRGLAYDETLAADAAQRARGWRVSADWQGTGAGRGRLLVRAIDRDGGPLSGLAATAELRRAVHAGADRRATLTEVAAATYAADLALPAPGNWQLTVRLARPGLPDYLLRRKIVVP